MTAAGGRRRLEGAIGREVASTQVLMHVEPEGQAGRRGAMRF
jgi:hypothetical protein